MKVKARVLFSIFFFLFISTNKAQVFTELHSFKLFADSLTHYSSIWMDVDQDYDVDLLNFSILNKPTQLYKNNQGKMLAEPSVFGKDGGNANGACYADIDMDGDLDVFVYSIFGQKNYLYIQESKGLFRKEQSLDITQQENNAFYATFSDVNADNYPDLLVTDTELWNPKSVKKQSRIYYNDGAGKFSKTKSQAFQVPKSDTRGMVLADFNDDAREDILWLNFGSANELYLKNNAHLFIKTNAAFTEQSGDYVDGKAIDADNDGDYDLVLLNLKTGLEFYKNEGNMNFTYVPLVFNTGGFKASGLELLDYNNDGSIDVLLHKAFSNEKKLFINQWKTHQYITLKLRADRANIHAIGAKVYVKTKQAGLSYWQYQELRANKQSVVQNLYEVNFGLGDAEKVDTLKISWPDGTEQIITDLSANAKYYIEQRNVPQLMMNASTGAENAKLKDLSIEVFADNFKYGDIAGITVFYENKGLISEDVEINIELSQAMKLFNSFPMPNNYTGKNFTWKIKNVPPHYRGIITLSVSAPNIEQTNTQEQEISVSIEPNIGDEEGSNNRVVLQRRFTN